MNQTRNATAVVILIEDIEGSELVTLRITSPLEQWSAAVHPTYVVATVQSAIAKHIVEARDTLERE